MSRTSYRAIISAFILTLGLVGASSTRAAAINYGNFGPVPPGVSFLQVIESSGTDAVPLYGPPAPFAVGLDFNPTSFVSASAGGTSDITDGQLNFTIKSLVLPTGGVGITNVALSESGDYSLFGTGTAATRVGAGAIVRVTVTEVDGVAVAPIALSPINGSVAFDLVATPGITQPWSLGLSLNVAGQLAQLQVPFTIGATRLDVVINNSLLSVSEAASIASIAKKEFIISTDTRIEGVIPEPASATLAGLMLVGLGARRRRA